MRERSGDFALFNRAVLDSRIAFVTASFLLAFAFAALLDRIGAPERFVGASPPWFTLIALAALGFLLHSMRVSFYYAGGRAIPSAYAGFANAAVAIALLLPFARRDWFAAAARADLWEIVDYIRGAVSERRR